LPRSGSGEHVLLDESSGQRAIGADEVTRRVTELVGLDFEAFCSSVLLAQGQFARFLEAATTQRTLILKGVFRLDQIDELRKAAKLKTNEVGLELATIEGELRAVPDDAEEQLVDARRRAQRAEERAGELERALPEEDQLEEAIEAASQELRAVGERRRTLADALVQIPAAGDLDGLAQQEAEVDTRLHRAETMLTDCEADLGRRVTELERVEQEFGTEAELVEARARARARGEAVAELERLAADEAERARALTELESAAATAHELAATAAATLEARKEDRRAAEQAHRAHALRKDLEPGQPCPVCEQEVTVIPRGRAPSALAKAERAEREAEATVAQTRSAAATVVAELSAARVTLQHVREGIDRATARIAATTTTTATTTTPTR
jgi:exonuclease SbcC